MIKENRNVIKGSPQLSFESNGKTITEWKIKGNTGYINDYMSGVGDKTKNLANIDTMLQGYWAYANGNFISASTWVCTPKISCKSNAKYTLSFNNTSRWYGFVWYDENDNFISTDNHQETLSNVSFTAVSPANAAFFGVNIADQWNGKTIKKEDMINFQVEQNDIATDFEPYGYKIPISINNQKTILYISSSLLDGDELTNNDLNISFPTKYGRNILKVETNVIPKNVELITYTDSSFSDYNYNCKLNTRNEILRTWATKDNGAIVPKSWNHVQFLVKQGLHKDVFHIGDELVCKRGNDDIVWQVIGMDIDEPADPQYKYSLTLCMRDLLPNDAVAFSARQALFYFPDGLSAGTYYFTITQHSWVASDVNKSFYFTLTNDIPKKGQIVLQNAHDVSCENKTLKTYSSSTSTTEIETATMYLWDDSIEATFLGNVNNSLQTNINCLQRAFLGNNNYKESHIRQWINGGEKATLVYQPQTVFDRPPSWNNTNVGLLKGMDNDFLKTVQSTKVKTARNTLTDGGGSDIIEDKFFLLSKPQIYGENTVENIDEGNVYPYFENYSSLSAASTGADKNRIKIKNDTAGWWWLRSPYVSHGSLVWYVYPAGTVYYSHAASAYGVAAACNIFG